MKINETRPLEHNFTEVLKTLALIPKMLYYVGKLPENGDFPYPCNAYASGQNHCQNCCQIASKTRPKCVAIVGSRKNTPYGKEVAYQAAYEATKAGAIVISGLAYGIDSIAHRGALDAGGITVAVLGTPIDDIYPRAHQNLAQEIIDKGGAIISEYAPGAQPESGTEMRVRFLERNRLIAGLADVVLIAEAAAKSGSLNTASHALDIGKDLMVVPGDINKLSSEGCNRLIMQGAMPYTRPDDLLNLLFPERIIPRRRSHKKLEKQLALFAETEVEQAVLAQILLGIQDGDEIIKTLQISTSDFSQAVTMLEIKGAIKALGANRWMGT